MPYITPQIITLNAKKYLHIFLRNQEMMRNLFAWILPTE